jgi:predicted acyltransferase
MYTGKRGQLAAFVACVGGYWLMMKCVPVPGHGAGDLSRFGNLAGYIDRHVFHAHLHKPGWDPEGLLHTLPAIGTCLLGALTGHWIRGEKSLPEKAAGLFTAGNICIVAGLILDRYFPINKNLWSPSYVFLCGGLSMSIHAACIWFVDIRGRNKATMPFVYMGMNPLFAYLMSSLVLAIFNLIPVAKAAGGTVTLKPYVFDHFYASWLSIKTASMCFALSYVVFWILVTGLMYKKKWFVKI